MRLSADNPLLALLQLSDNEKEARGLRYTPQEIFQQPGSWLGTYRGFLAGKPEINSFLENAGLTAHSSSPPVVFLIGAGSSDYIGRSLTRLLRRMWCCEVSAVPSTDLLPAMEEFIVDKNYLWISFSRSGDSTEGVAVLETALETHPHVRHLVITCNQAGAMVQLCNDSRGKALALVLQDAVNDRGLAMTSSFTNMVVAGHCLAHFRNAAEYEEILSILVELGGKFLSSAAEAAWSITRADCSRGACFTGCGPLHAVANESALKMLELTAGKVHTMSESTLGLRHGPMSALDQDTLLVHFVSGDPRRRNYDFDLLQEIRTKRLARRRVVVTPREFSDLDGVADYVLSLGAQRDFDDAYRVPVDVMLGQLLGLFASLQAGLKPDCPSPAGVISRVVSGVKVYA
jgi:tagatose-6-phosphate ketose/aldose isomerase